MKVKKMYILMTFIVCCDAPTQMSSQQQQLWQTLNGVPWRNSQIKVKSNHPLSYKGLSGRSNLGPDARGCGDGGQGAPHPLRDEANRRRPPAKGWFDYVHDYY